MDDFDAVSIGQRAAGVLAARHDFLVEFHCHASPRIAGLFEQLRDGGGGGAVARVAIEHDVHPRIVAIPMPGAVCAGAQKQKPASRRAFASGTVARWSVLTVVLPIAWFGFGRRAWLRVLRLCRRRRTWLW